MDLSLNISESIALITVSGMIDTLNSERFLSEIESLPEEAKGIGLDLERVDYISSAGLRVLLRALDIAGERGGEMKVIKSSDFVREILVSVGFHKLFSVE